MLNRVTKFACLLLGLHSLLGTTSLLSAAGWHKTQAGPFEIFTNQDVRPAKLLLGDLEQLRYQIEALTGVTDPVPLWPIRIVVAKGESPTDLRLTTQYWQLVSGTGQLSREQKKQIARALLHPNSGPLDPKLEAALLSVLAGLQSSGSRVTLGALPPAAEQTEDWVLLNFLITDESFRGRLRVFLGNLMRGADQASALRNAFELDEAALRQIAAAARPAFAPVTFAAKPILPERDYRARTAPDTEGSLELAIAKLDRAGCLPAKDLPDLKLPVLECLAITSNSAAEAQAALAAGSLNPHIHYLAAVNQEDRLEHQRQLFTAIQRKPLYPAAALAFASKENDSQKAYRALKAASPAALRDAAFQAKFAEIATRAAQHSDAAKAWAAAERATFDPAEREKMGKMRLASMDRRLEAEAEARRLAEEERLRDIERVRQASLARIRIAEAKARGKMDPLPEGTEIADWWDGAQANAYFRGQLVRIECLSNKRARFAILGEGKTELFDVEDPGKIVLMGKGAESWRFRCGVQAKPAEVRAGYFRAETNAAEPAAKKIEIDPNFELNPNPQGQLRRRTAEEGGGAESAKPVQKTIPTPKKSTAAKQPAAPAVTLGRLLTLEILR
ncbi:MAG: hypothetical protein NW208_11605 [Bryobacter sp.]|nr:hypothetical protein [Bryobacter sp.]